MTSISSTSSGSAALLLLRQAQAAPLSGNGQQTATGTNLDTTSGDKDAVMATIKRLATAWQARRAAQANAAPRRAESAGTVSVAASSAWKSGMASATAAAMGASGNTAEIGAGGTSIASTVDTAEALVGWLASDTNDYNGKFNLRQIPTREEHEASKDSTVAGWIAKGLSEQIIANSLKYSYGEGGYERYVQTIDTYNQGLVRSSEIAEDRLRNAAAQRLKEAFGINVQISYDEGGRASVAPFDIHYRSGQKMLSYGEDGSLTSYNADGSVKLTLSNKEAAKIAQGYYMSQDAAPPG